MIVLWWGATLFGAMSILCAGVYAAIAVKRLCFGECLEAVAPALIAVGYAAYVVACFNVQSAPWLVVVALIVWFAIQAVIALTGLPRGIGAHRMTHGGGS